MESDDDETINFLAARKRAKQNHEEYDGVSYIILYIRLDNDFRRMGETHARTYQNRIIGCNVWGVRSAAFRRPTNSAQLMVKI